MFFRHWNIRLRVGAAVTLLFLVLGFAVSSFCPIPDVMAWGSFPKSRPPGGGHILGTTALGQDIFWLAVMSLRNSLLLGLLTAFLSTALGVAVGLFSGLRGGAADRVATLFTDSLIAVPNLPILILLGSILKGRIPIPALALVLTLFSWPWPARATRSMTLSIRESDFISTARFSGEGTLKIIAKEIFPFVSDWSVASFTNAILSAIQTESGLAIIGMSSNTMPTLGTMIYWANDRSAILSEQWFWIGAPVVLVTLLFIALFMTLSGYQAYATMRRGK
ncbi:MAG: ABC transporter permease [Clostridiales bacterium]|jgi:peptide/nickel transport system permease protein|nr:ABC transporter permease [Clostridiales bacterium]